MYGDLCATVDIADTRATCMLLRSFEHSSPVAWELILGSEAYGLRPLFTPAFMDLLTSDISALLVVAYLRRPQVSLLAMLHQ